MACVSDISVIIRLRVSDAQCLFLRNMVIATYLGAWLGAGLGDGVRRVY